MESAPVTDEPGEALGIDVVVPVYGAAIPLERCLRSLTTHTAMPPHRVVLSVDGPQPVDVEKVLAELAAPSSGEFIVLRSDERRGFVGAANRGLRHSARDVILLNADTEVTAGWIEKLSEAARSRPDVATVTPLSNNATICSIPEPFEDNLLPTGWSTDRLAELVEQVSERRLPQLPTGVGVCLYIRRAALDAVGLLDERRFGLGYGEENELCIRLSRAGYVHLADDATFIFHAGQRSFGAESRRRVRRATRTLRRLDPTYWGRVAEFLRRDPLESLRHHLWERIAPVLRTPQLSVLHVVHGWPPFAEGGTEAYARRLAMDQVKRHRVSVLARWADPHRATGDRAALFDEGVRVRLLVNHFDQRNPLIRNAMLNPAFERELDSMLDRERPNLVHVHHLAGLSASLASVAAKRGIPVVYQIQDWWASCSRANLVTSERLPCRGPSLGACSSCLPMTGLRPRWLLNRALYLVRGRWITRQMASAAGYVMGSDAIHAWHRQRGLLAPGTPVWVIPYGVPEPCTDHQRRPVGTPLRVGVIATLMAHKGIHVAVRACQGLGGIVTLDIWGNTDADPDYTRALQQELDPEVVALKGRFEEADRDRILAGLDLLIVPSIGLESFGIVAAEAMAVGTPVIASRLGALAGLGDEGRFGATFPAGDAGELRTWLLRLVERPGLLESWRASMPRSKSVHDHALEIDAVYDHVLSRTAHREPAE